MRLKGQSQEIIFYLYVFWNIYLLDFYFVFSKLKSSVGDWQSRCFYLFTLEVKIFLMCLFRVYVILYPNWVLLFFLVIDFIIYFTLKNFVSVPSEQNVFVVPHLGFLWASSLAVAKEPSGPSRVLRHFAFCSFLCRLFRSVVF